MLQSFGAKIPKGFKSNCSLFACMLMSSIAAIMHKLKLASFLFFYGLEASFSLVRPWQVKGGRLVGHTMQSQTEHLFDKQLFNGRMTFQTWIDWDPAALKLTRDDKIYFERKFDPRMSFEDSRNFHLNYIISSHFEIFTHYFHQNDCILACASWFESIFLMRWIIVGQTICNILYF